MVGLAKRLLMHPSGYDALLSFVCDGNRDWGDAADLMGVLVEVVTNPRLVRRWMLNVGLLAARISAAVRQAGLPPHQASAGRLIVRAMGSDLASPALPPFVALEASDGDGLAASAASILSNLLSSITLWEQPLHCACLLLVDDEHAALSKRTAAISPLAQLLVATLNPSNLDTYLVLASQHPRIGVSVVRCVTSMLAPGLMLEVCLVSWGAKVMGWGGGSHCKVHWKAVFGGRALALLVVPCQLVTTFRAPFVCRAGTGAIQSCVSWC